MIEAGTGQDAASGDRRTFLERLGATSDGEGRLILRPGPEHLRSLGIVHGGMIATLLDSVMGLDVSRRAPEEYYAVTVQLNINYIRPAFPAETLIASSTIKHLGRSTAVAQGELRTESGTLVATSSGTFCFVAHTDRTRGLEDRLDPGPG
ncbi:PaaI family thioesterase [Tundrisphaera sp. TA3]|uniref:PaaI family thioesterase n=1 Tax=Tundrisphaera sp. TA3 TaxID=3435775 RepID=UPI003EC1146C